MFRSSPGRDLIGGFLVSDTHLDAKSSWDRPQGLARGISGLQGAIFIREVGAEKVEAQAVVFDAEPRIDHRRLHRLAGFRR